jgi:hypothetical protein
MSAVTMNRAATIAPIPANEANISQKDRQRFADRDPARPLMSSFVTGKH